MKTRTFKQKWNKTALRRIKKEFTASGKTYLCHGSKEFWLLWEEHRKEIILLSLKHFPAEREAVFPPIRRVLFYHEVGRQPRIKFLDLEIQRLSKPKKPKPSPVGAMDL